MNQDAGIFLDARESQNSIGFFARDHAHVKTGAIPIQQAQHIVGLVRVILARQTECDLQGRHHFVQQQGVRNRFGLVGRETQRQLQRGGVVLCPDQAVCVLRIGLVIPLWADVGDSQFGGNFQLIHLGERHRVVVTIAGITGRHVGVGHGGHHALTPVPKIQLIAQVAVEKIRGCQLLQQCAHAGDLARHHAVDDLAA